MQAGCGTVILLNGTSSAGKTTIARELQTRLDSVFLHVGIDHFMSMLPSRYFGVGPPFTRAALEGFRWVRPPTGEETRGVVIEAGPLAQQVVSSYHRSVASLARTGMNVIVDDVLLDPDWLDDWLAVLEGIPALLVGVRCPLAEIERRELARGDREPGQARRSSTLCICTESMTSRWTRPCTRRPFAPARSSSNSAWQRTRPATRLPRLRRLR